ncbi:MAG TPA: YdcF family protein [Pyrinomonadaceae bacterium]|nr:YdcF family protein [Pyrinomonadaceae bacterium]
MGSGLQFLKGARARRLLPLALVILAAWAVAARAAAEALIVSDELPRADALVVLAGSSAYVERTARAAELYRAGRAPLVLLTDDGQRGGWSPELERNPSFAERAAWELERGGVPREAVVVLPRRVASTHDEAALVFDYANARGLHSVMLVTSAYHTRRALWTFRRAFEGSGVAVGVSAVAPGVQTPSAATWWLSPRGWRAVAGEYVKFFYYELRY